MLRTFLALALLAWLCTQNTLWKGAVWSPHREYTAEVVCTTADGIASPDGVAWLDGQLYFADEGGSCVRVRAADGTLRTLADASQGIHSPEDIAVASDGRVYFTDDDMGGVWEIDPEGTLRRIAGPDEGLTSTEGLTITPDGDLLVGDGHQQKIYRVTREGAVSTFDAPGIDKPESFAFDDAGNLYIADDRQNRVFRRDADGTMHTVLTQKDGLNSPETIAWHAGALYIADNEGGKLWRYTPNGDLKPLMVFAGKLQNVQGLTFGRNGDIYITVQTDLGRRQGAVLKLISLPPAAASPDAP
jgi:sugar lactone lactonase YvrE